MRDHVEEARLLNEAANICQRVYGESAPRFARTVRQRLAKGAAQYGDSDYLSKDNLIEASLESPDLAAYAMLDYQRVAPSLSALERQELRQHTLGVLAATINLEAALSRLRYNRDELLS